ncbi:hypothetical protein D0Z00_003260 [Geotrichum galactomycetum]|uniref:Uncharacterized protein n=1 Tax=Geotrichum galactomycetum TaxID=27317 RepID=A0ACB6V1R1_9ASCO|nr:hypothetical protein D0Z00_003260 [Geotrichum candidum]
MPNDTHVPNHQDRENSKRLEVLAALSSSPEESSNSTINPGPVAPSITGSSTRPDTPEHSLTFNSFGRGLSPVLANANQPALSDHVGNSNFSYPTNNDPGAQRATLRDRFFGSGNAHQEEDIEMISTFGPNNREILEVPLFDDSSTLAKKQNSIAVREVSATETLSQYGSWVSRETEANPTLRARAAAVFSVVRDFVLRIEKPLPSAGCRTIPVELVNNRPLLVDARTHKPYCDNLITSSIYNVYNFLPRQLVAQFSKLANL